MSEMIIPQEIQDLFDQASQGDNKLSITFTAKSVRLVNPTESGLEIVKEIEWEKAGSFSDQLLKNILENSKNK